MIPKDWRKGNAIGERFTATMREYVAERRTKFEEFVFTHDEGFSSGVFRCIIPHK